MMDRIKPHLTFIRDRYVMRSRITFAGKDNQRQIEAEDNHVDLD